MSEELNSVSPSTENVVTPVTQETTQPVNEKTFKQADVDEIVHKRTSEVKAKAEQTGYERAKAELAAQSYATKASAPVAEQPAVQASLSEDRIRQIVAEQTENFKTQGIIDHGLNTFKARVEEGLSDPDYPDYRETVQTLNTDAMTPVALLASTFENTKDIVYHLGKDPLLAADLMDKASKPQFLPFVQAKLAELSKSITQSKVAKSAPVANAPLSQVTPSTTGVDSGSLTHEQRRQKPSLRV